jgi:hypothetical protein
MVRKVLRAISKDCLSMVPLDTAGGCLKQLTAVGECGLALTSGIPVLQAYYNMFVRSGRGLRGKFNPRNLAYGLSAGDGLVKNVVMVDDESRYSFWLAFGVEPDMQVALEEYYDSVVIDPGVQDITGSLELPPWIC